MTDGNVIKNRSEIVFLYDIKDANPNGDPMDENKPRIDEETEINIVTDVRLKRTIRDYLSKYKKKEIFIIEEIKSDGTQKTKEERINELKIKTAEDSKNSYRNMSIYGCSAQLLHFLLKRRSRQKAVRLKQQNRLPRKKGNHSRGSDRFSSGLDDRYTRLPHRPSRAQV